MLAALYGLVVLGSLLVAPAALAAGAQSVDERAVEDALRVALRSGPGGDVVRVDALKISNRLRIEGRRRLEYRPDLPGRDALLGRLSVPVHVLAGHRELGTVWVQTSLSQRRPVLVLRRRVRPGETLAAGDVEIDTRWESRPQRQLWREAPSFDAGPVRARRALAPGDPLKRSDLRLDPLASRGQQVRVVLRRGPLEVSTTATLTSAGRRGEVVRMRTLNGRRELEGVLVAPAEVKLQ